MFRTICDAIISIIFVSLMGLGATKTYSFFKNGARERIEKGLGSTVKFNRALTGKKFDWE